MISKVTITGADDSVKPQDLINLQKEFPFVEWGILLSRNQHGNYRYPSLEWLSDLFANHFGLSLSGHLCGSFVRELARGDGNFITNELERFWPMFRRIQLNFHGIPHQHSKAMIDVLSRYPDKEFIFQYDEVNGMLLKETFKAGINCSALFDKSGGNGILPGEWPRPLAKIKCGYAGGLSPENLKEQIVRIEEKVEQVNTWIDMETHVRSNMDAQFDLDKVRQCLEIASATVRQNQPMGK